MIKNSDISTKVQNSGICLNQSCFNKKTSLMKINDKITSKKNSEREFLQELKESIPKRMDKLPFLNYHFKILLIIFLIFTLIGFESNFYDINYQSFRLSLSVGCISGSFLFQIIAHLFSRQTAFCTIVLLYSIIIVVQFFISYKKRQILTHICKFIIGFTILGGGYSTIYPYINIIIQKRFRGLVNTITLVIIPHIGILIHYLLSISLLKFRKSIYKKFNYELLFPLIISLPLLFLKNFLSESPRILAQNGKFRSASEMLIYLEDNYTKRIRSNRSNKSNRLVSLPDLMFPNIRIKPLKVLKCLINNKKKMVYCTLLTLFTAFFNYYFIVYFIYLNPVQIFSVKLNLIEIYLISSILGGLFLCTIIEKLSRKFIYLMYCFIIILLLIIFTLSIFIKEEKSNVKIKNLDTLLQSNLIKAISSFIIFFIIVPFCSLSHLAISELYSLQHREIIITLYYSLNHLVSITKSFFPNNCLSVFWKFFLLIIYCLILLLIIYKYGIDTTNKSLEDLAKNKHIQIEGRMNPRSNVKRKLEI